MIDNNDLAARFMRYVRVDTQSDPSSEKHPTTEKQKDLSRMLVTELQQLGIENAHMDEFGYVYASIPSNSPKKDIPVVCFCSHVDTAPDCSGTDVRPILHKSYDGSDIILPDDPSQVLRLADSPYLRNHLGCDIITASGKTLLGADDKSGVAAIMQAVKYLVDNPGVLHGDVRILFTPDEEVGKGTARIDMKKLGADFGYTLDGGEAGCLEDETFSADAASVTFHGIIVHPGYAKGKLVNALKLASAFVEALPKDEWSPETTDGRQGFVHPVGISGNAEQATVQFIVRDFVTSVLPDHHARLNDLAHGICSRFEGTSFTYTPSEQYRNMKDVLVNHPHVTEYATEAIRRVGLPVISDAIRGGTDGSRLSYMGLPCPNIFTGMQNIHSKLEWIGVNDMARAAACIVHLTMVVEERS